MKYLIIFTILTLSFWAREKAAIEIPSNELAVAEHTEEENLQPTTSNQSKENIIGLWEWRSSNDKEHTFSLVEQFRDEYGVAFENDTDMYEWFTGRCFTQGVHYVEYEANYTLNESVLEFKSRVLGGNQFNIIYSDDTMLILEEL